ASTPDQVRGRLSPFQGEEIRVAPPHATALLVIRMTMGLLFALLGLSLQVAAAQAQISRTCVSAAKGSDSNSASSCNCATPGRALHVAHDNPLGNGEITVLDPGGYGGLTITKSISIVNDGGGEAGILAYTGQPVGITVNAPAGAFVNLRGLTVEGFNG